MLSVKINQLPPKERQFVIDSTKEAARTATAESLLSAALRDGWQQLPGSQDGGVPEHAAEARTVTAAMCISQEIIAARKVSAVARVVGMNSHFAVRAGGQRVNLRRLAEQQFLGGRLAPRHRLRCGGWVRGWVGDRAAWAVGISRQGWRLATGSSAGRWGAVDAGVCMWVGGWWRRGTGQPRDWHGAHLGLAYSIVCVSSAKLCMCTGVLVVDKIVRAAKPLAPRFPPSRSDEWRARVSVYWERHTRCSTAPKHNERRRGPPHPRHWLECAVVSRGGCSAAWADGWPACRHAGNALW